MAATTRNHLISFWDENGKPQTIQIRARDQLHALQRLFESHYRWLDGEPITISRGSLPKPRKPRKGRRSQPPAPVQVKDPEINLELASYLEQLAEQEIEVQRRTVKRKRRQRR